MRMLLLFLLWPSIFLAQETTSINFQNTERSNHATLYDGLLTYDLNFYNDYPEFGSDGGGLNIYSGEDGWGAVFDTNNMRWLKPEFAGLNVNGTVTLNPGLSNNNYVDFISNTNSQINMVFYSQNEAKWNFYTSSDGKFYFRKTNNNPNGGVKMTLDGDNVGIGTSNPGAKLHVYGSTVGMGNIISSIMIGRVRGPEIQAIQEGADEDVQGLAFRVKSSAAFADPNFEAMRISRNGNLGIGTTDPGNYKLAVKGKIRAEEIKVETGWADYVFQEGYDLPSLEEVEQHIKEKGHLINIPSAKEVEENGVELGEMNKLLLEKMEELTLYTLQQQKELENYKKDMMLLNKKLEAMQQQINNLKN